MATHEGTVPFDVGDETAETWYRITGDLRPDDAGAPPPLIVLHGGPGATHDYLLAIADLADSGRAVVHYDQVGNGRSTHYPERGADFWTVDLFVRELHNLVDALGLRERHHVLGQSWGGFLAQEYALTHPQGLRALVLANTAASFPDFVSEANRLRAEPARGRSDPPTPRGGGHDRRAGVRRRLHGLLQAASLPPRPRPAEVDESFAWIDRDPTVYHTMNGPSEFHVIGSIRDWQSKDRLGSIDIPTLIVSGLYDEAAPPLQEVLRDGIRGSEWVLLEESSHLSHLEERERYMQVVGDWLARHDEH